MYGCRECGGTLAKIALIALKLALLSAMLSEEVPWSVGSMMRLQTNRISDKVVKAVGNV
jgi:hypothetical protein